MSRTTCLKGVSVSHIKTWLRSQIILGVITFIEATFAFFFQKNECTSTNAMEVEGFKRCLTEVLARRKISVESIVTDRHMSVRKLLREKYPKIDHWFDIWHVAKSKSILNLSYSAW